MAIRKKVFRYLIIAVVIALIFLTILWVLKQMLPGFVEVLEEGDGAKIQAYVRGFGTIQGVFIGILLQFMQLISIVFPGGVLQISMGIIFGTWLGFGICYVGYVAASCAVFLAVRGLGDKLNDWLPSKEEENVKKLGFIRRIKSPSLMVMITCMFPLVPNGVVPYLAAHTNMKFKTFLLSVAVGCAPGLLLLCAAGNKILHGKYLEAGIYGAVLMICLALMAIKQNEILALVEKIRLKFKRDSQSEK